MQKSLLLTLLLASVLCGLSLASFGAATERGYVSGSYALQLDNINCGTFKEASGGGVHAEVISETLGPLGYAKKHIGQPVYDPFTLKVGLNMNPALYEWIARSWTTSPLRKNGAIVALNYQQNATSTRQFTNALISETTIPDCDGSSKDASFLTLTINPEFSKDIVLPAMQPAPLGEEQKKWLPANFRLEIDGIDCSRVSKIDNFTIKHSVTTNNVGEERVTQNEPGKLTFPNLRITISDAGIASWKQWLDDFVVKGNNSDTLEKNGRLIFLAPDMQTELARVEFKHLGICSLAPEKTEAGGEQIHRTVAEVYCEQMVFKYSGGAPVNTTRSMTKPSADGDYAAADSTAQEKTGDTLPAVQPTMPDGKRG